jgi:hypothetical protein
MIMLTKLGNITTYISLLDTVVHVARSSHSAVDGLLNFFWRMELSDFDLLI